MGETAIERHSRSRAVDIFTSLFLVVSGALVLAWWARIPQASWLCPLYFAGALAAFFAPPVLRRSKRFLFRFLSDWYPIFAFTVLYLGTALLNQASPIAPLDPWLADLDRTLFGALLCDRLQSTLPHLFFAEIMAFFYFSYYLIIPALSLILWCRNRALFHEFLLITASCFYLFYLVFSIVPAYGPQFAYRDGLIQWSGVFFGPFLTQILSQVEQPTGAFPSSHAGIALLFAYFARLHSRALGALFAVVLAGLSPAILYGGPHYFIDLPCGLVVALLFIVFHRIRR